MSALIGYGRNYDWNMTALIKLVMFQVTLYTR